MEFAYEATDADGSLIEGTLTADDAEQALDQIRDSGYVPLRLVPDLPDEEPEEAEVEPEEAGDARSPDSTPTNTEDAKASGADPGANKRDDDEAAIAGPTLPTAVDRPRAHEFEWSAPSGLPDGVPPAAPPRTLKVGFFHRFTDPLAAFGLAFGSIALLLSVIFLFVNVWAALIPLAFLSIGAAIGSVGFRAVSRRTRAWRYGEPAAAEIIWIGQDTSYKVNGRSPWMMRYRFAVGEEEVVGTRKSFNEDITELKLHQRIWIVYLPENPEISAEWPPII